MSILAHIPPRRVILTLTILGGLGLRLWGLAWGSGLEADQNPHEWTWQVIARLSWSEPTYPGLWNQTFFSLAAMLRGALSLVAGWLAVWLGEVRTLAEVALSARLAGRLAVAFMGGGQIWLAYLLGRRAFDSVATGLLAAAVVAVSPLMVTHAHYLSLEVPLGFMALWLLWVTWGAVEGPSLGRWFGVGVVLGLTATTAPAGASLALVVLAGYGAALRRERPGPLRGFLAWPALALAGLAVGLLLGFPGLVLEPETWPYSLEQGLAWPEPPGGGWQRFLLARLGGLWGQWVGVGGLELVALWLVGLGLICWRRRWPRLLVAMTSLLLLAFGVASPSMELESQQAVWLPAAAVLACWPLVILCRKMPRYGWQAAGVAVLGVGMCVWPLWRSLGVGYLFWQQDTLGAARAWLEANLPASAPVVAGPGAPLTLVPQARPWQRGQDAAEIMKAGAWLVTSQETPPGPMSSSSPPASLLAGLQRVQVLDLTRGWGLGRLPPPHRFPRWVSPPVVIHAPAPPRDITHRLALSRPAVDVQRAYAVVYPSLPDYSRDAAAMLVPRGGRGQRVLRQDGQPTTMGILVENLGENLAVGQVSQGPLASTPLRLYPGQKKTLDLPAETWPPMVEGVYPVRVSLSRGGPVLARMSNDSLLLGRQALEDDRLQEAVNLLRAGPAPPGDGFDRGAMLANALARLGLYQEASRMLAGLSGRQGEPAASYQELATAAAVNPKWDDDFSHLTGYIPWLLRQATSLEYRIDGPLCQSQGQDVPLSGGGYTGTYQRVPGKVGGYLRLWLEDYFPAAGLRAVLGLAAKGSPKPADEVCRVEVWSHAVGGASLLARAPVLGRHLAKGRTEVSLSLEKHDPGSRLEVRLLFTSPHDLTLDRLRLEVDLRAHMRRMLLWYFEAWGLTSLEAKRYGAAAEAFQKVLDLDPGHASALLPLSRALIDSGKLDEALAMTKRAELRFADMPRQLTQVAELYQTLNRPEDAARVEARLGHLRPSLHHESRFAGGLTLLGYDLPSAEVRPGEGLDMSYYWRAWETPALNYYVFVHLVGPEITLNYDHLLDHGRLAMTGLKPGQVVREDYRLNIPADASPGSYQLIVGLWDPRFTGKRVAVLEGEGVGGEEVPLAAIQVR